MARLIHLLCTSFTLISLAHTQSERLPIPCCTIEAADISPSTRVDYCNTNLSSCAKACSRSGSTDGMNNQCDPVTLNYICRCTNGAQPDLSHFTATISSMKCYAWWQSCFGQTKNSPEAQACNDAKHNTCPNRTDVENAMQYSSLASSSPTVLTTLIASNVMSWTPSSSFSAIIVSASNPATSSTSSASVTAMGGFTASSSSESGGVRIETVVGAVVGAVAVMIITVIGAWCVWRRRQKKSKAVTKKLEPAESVEKGKRATVYAKAELHGTSTLVQHIELHGNVRAELHRDDVAELHENAKAAQLSVGNSVRVGARAGGDR